MGQSACSEGELLPCCFRAPDTPGTWGQSRKGVGQTSSKSIPTISLLGDFLKCPLLSRASIYVCKNGDTAILVCGLKSVMKEAAKVMKGTG